MFKTLITAVLLAAIPAITAHAQANCGARDALVTHLGKKYGEQLTSGGLTGTTRLMEVWTSEETGSWTLLMTDPNGRSCILASGRDWLDFPREQAKVMGELDS